MDSENKEEIPVHEEFILCGGVETHVIKCGPWTDLINDQSGNRPKLLIFFIAGNPGFSSLYTPFMKALYSSTNKRFPVWTISHAGHIVAPKDKNLTASDESNAQEIKDIYGLRGQIEHKLAFLRAHVPKDMKLVVISHSIGCYMTLQILKIAPELQIIRAFLLFPTIERMSESPSGKIVTPLLRWFRYALYATGYILLKPCPAFIKSLLIKTYFWFTNVENEQIETYFLEPFCLGSSDPDLSLCVASSPRSPSP
ncbi:lipid droplet-associated hydrolase [Suncus etruscus]|uniref:lipid droplet-associated hydrolase n=1 Tax=Suncus etruscus TaxID=109475 RepID=UPI00210F2F2D|nr:lipid droplet-associated hydrolase [Suncus etruscus]